jgi:Na+-driven multidrug efflux pump
MREQNVFGYSLSIVATVAVGQLNEPTVLSAVVLAGSIYNVTGGS